MQYVELNGHRLLRNEISCRVPQGSILEPLFSLLLINDIINVSSLLNLMLSNYISDRFVKFGDGQTVNVV